MSLRDVRRVIADRKIRFVDFRFTDLLGGWRHISYAIEAFDEDMFVHGIGFDGSSVRGFQGIEDSDMLLRPDPDSGFIDPFYEDPTMVFICNVKDPVDLSLYSRDPRNIVEKATRFPGDFLDRGYVFRGPGSGVLHLRRRALRPDGERGLLPRGRRLRRLERRT